MNKYRKFTWDDPIVELVRQLDDSFKFSINLTSSCYDHTWQTGKQTAKYWLTNEFDSIHDNWEFRLNDEEFSRILKEINNKTLDEYANAIIQKELHKESLKNLKNNSETYELNLRVPKESNVEIFIDGIRNLHIKNGESKC